MKNYRANFPIDYAAELHKRAHHEVVGNPYWFSDKPELLGPAFSAEKTDIRARDIIGVMQRAARGKSLFADHFFLLADRLSGCTDNNRCGSTACVKCLRAFRQAKTVAHRELITRLAKLHGQKLVYLTTIIPWEQNYGLAHLTEFDATAFKRLLAEPFSGYRLPFVGSVDFDLRTAAAGKYVQPHFHIAMYTGEYELARTTLKWHFDGKGKWAYPVDLTEMTDLHVVPYIHKAIKINNLLRNHRRCLPELLLALNNVHPLAFLVMKHVVLSVQEGGFKFEIV